MQCGTQLRWHVDDALIEQQADAASVEKSRERCPLRRILAVSEKIRPDVLGPVSVAMHSKWHDGGHSIHVEIVLYLHHGAELYLRRDDLRQCRGIERLDAGKVRFEEAPHGLEIDGARVNKRELDVDESIVLVLAVLVLVLLLVVVTSRTWACEVHSSVRLITLGAGGKVGNRRGWSRKPGL